jgi:AcrR family transcriptional regulator
LQDTLPKSRHVGSKVKRGRPPGSSAEATRQRLLLAAARYFSSAEYSEVSLQDIAAECGITGAAIYNHFSSKEELFASVAEHMMKVNGKAIQQAIADHTEWRSMLRAVLRLICKDTTGWFRFTLLVPAVQLKMMQKPEKFASLLTLRAVYVDCFRQIVDCAVAAGDLPQATSKAAAAELLLAFTFNGLGAVIAHRTSDEEVAELVHHAAILLGFAKQA